MCDENRPQLHIKVYRTSEAATGASADRKIPKNTAPVTRLGRVTRGWGSLGSPPIGEAECVPIHKKSIHSNEGDEECVQIHRKSTDSDEDEG